MTVARPTLHMIYGKIASGRSTLAAHLAAEPGTVRLDEDALLAALYGPEMETLADFVRRSARLRSAMAPMPSPRPRRSSARSRPISRSPVPKTGSRS